MKKLLFLIFLSFSVNANEPVVSESKKIEIQKQNAHDYGVTITSEVNKSIVFIESDFTNHLFCQDFRFVVAIQSPDGRAYVPSNSFYKGRLFLATTQEEYPMLVVRVLCQAELINDVKEYVITFNNDVLPVDTYKKNSWFTRLKKRFFG